MHHRVNQLVSKLSISFLVPLLALDLAFILLHIAARMTHVVPNEPQFLITQDGGYAEQFQYVKLLLIVLGLGLLAIRQRSRIFFTWTGIFLYILLDDALELHERLGFLLEAAWQLPAIGGLRGQDLGELLVFASVGIISLISLVWSYRTERQPATRRTSVYLFVLLLLFAVFGGVVDMVHMAVSAIASPLWLQRLFTILEDGGEMVMVSIIAAFVYRLTKSKAPTPAVPVPAPIYAEKQAVK
ncbi:hypothetical protein ACN4EK_05275 [Pantanalinema rosaneae CENA516]|uniref:hypothetical protein n=1 Tax=Pantanalinema rosaneae TaxID=1620701 RepID=UPI003D7000B0